tara:strand:- start:365 stop:1072 length:708 start_codon:yes stop_codon:yes gene_type:complete
MDIKPLIIGLIFLLSGFFYFSFTGGVIQEESYFVERVIDGDTIQIEDGQKVRLIGINTPEKLVPFYDESKEFLRNKIENKTIVIENYGRDKYGRILGHVFFEKDHVNKEILSRGFGTLYYYEKDLYYDSLLNSEKFARLNENGIWKKSSKEACLELIELRYKEFPERCSNNERLVIKNNCEEIVQFIFKDDANHIYYEILEGKSTLDRNFSCIFNDAGDSLYAFDQEGLLMFFRY